jgi:hypothetical protein
MQAMTTVVGWSVNGVLTAQLARPLPSACLLLVKATSISPTIATAANSVFNMVNMGFLRLAGWSLSQRSTRAR